MSRGWFLESAQLSAKSVGNTLLSCLRPPRPRGHGEKAQTAQGNEGERRTSPVHSPSFWQSHNQCCRKTSKNLNAEESGKRKGHGQTQKIPHESKKMNESYIQSNSCGGLKKSQKQGCGRLEQPALLSSSQAVGSGLGGSTR